MKPTALLPILLALTLAGPTDKHLDTKRDSQKIPPPESGSGYAPVLVTCPAGSLVRPASTGVNKLERAWITARKKKADKALATWLNSTSLVKFPKPDSAYPVLGMASSGGGFRSMLTSAGVHRAFDARESSGLATGLYQALTYESGLSGGSWLVSALAGNNWPTISSLNANLWQSTLGTSVVDQVLFHTGDSEYQAVIADIRSKNATGFPPTVTDFWGRLLSYQLLYGSDGGVGKTMSGIQYLSNFASHSVPFPILTAIGANAWEGECLGSTNGTQYEFTPFEFGSWDDGVAAFTRIDYLGSSLSKGYPVDKSSCYLGFDQISMAFGTSSNDFNWACASIPASINLFINAVVDLILGVTGLAATRALYAVYPNPFRNYKVSTKVSAQKELYIGDGAESFQNDPIWPFLRRGVGTAVNGPPPKHPWNVDVLIVSDNAGDTDDNWPNGTALYNTYRYAEHDIYVPGMPEIPTPAQFVKYGLNKKPVLFGCSNEENLLILYLPNQQYTFPSNTDTEKLWYSPEDTTAMINNGAQIATAGDDTDFAVCLRCAIMLRSIGVKPDACYDCYDQMCWREPYDSPYPPDPPAGDCAAGGGECNSYYTCGIDGSNCYCGHDNLVNTICFQDVLCNDAATCVSNEDCGAGARCLDSGNCCGFSICVPVDVCSNPAVPTRIFGTGKSAVNASGS